MNDPSLILLTDRLFQPTLVSSIREHADASDIAVEAVGDLSELAGVLSKATGPKRLIAFCTGIIVPSSILNQITSGAYNFHPGPPEYPGVFPSCFAIYEDAPEFGATAHRMTLKIDGGEIVGVKRFPLPSMTNRLYLDKLALESVFELFQGLLPALIDFKRDIPETGDSWQGTSRTKKDFDALCALPSDVSAEEFDRRYRAVGEGPEHALSIDLYGHRFKLNSDHSDEAVVRGGVSEL